MSTFSSSTSLQRRIVIYAAFLLAVIFMAWSIRVWGTAFGWFRSPSNGTRESAPAQATSTVSATSTVEHFIDGAQVPPEMASGTLFATMIDNTPEAYPRAGLADAPLVVEAPVEGGISRLLAFFMTGQKLDAIGPVRSARPYFIDYARMFGAGLYVHVGGSPDALSALNGAPWNVDQFSRGGYFARASSRTAPHNVFTSPSEIDRIAAKLGAGETPQSIWFFGDEVKPEDRGGGSVLHINFGVTDVSWRYNRDTNQYDRLFGGDPETAFGGKQISATNVVVVQTSLKVIDTDGRLALATSGSGQALFLQNGQSVKGTWQKLSSTAPLKFFDMNSNEIRLARGPVWIEIVGDGVVWDNN